MLLNSPFTEPHNSTTTWQEFRTNRDNEILKPLYRDTGQKPERMRRQIFHYETKQMYYIHQQDSLLDEHYPLVQAQAELEYNCYLYASILGLNLPEIKALSFYQDAELHIAHMVLATQEVPGTRLADILPDETIPACLRKELAHQAAWDATKITISYGDNDRKPKNMIVTNPFTHDCQCHHVDFEYAMSADYVSLIDNWFSEDMPREFGRDICLSRSAVMELVLDLLNRVPGLPLGDFRNRIIQNLNQAIAVIKTHPSLMGTIL
ncbi:hypothetical protein [Adhaeribacter radiodurans]|uniref:Uncharacterized protein n=1 Tax=Adhaeribacter radiodurans TaxID=2745197 RepID=A0A7L7L2S1_9BACT|nr:hypothetical protein [Adhaeribacter radiodurans]QMU27097.1 hypothetical protein HUW48_03205 [Adhaeribacter radiodurans]